MQSLPNLDEVVLGALRLFERDSLPKLRIGFKRPLIVGSGNAANSGKIMFRKLDAVFADESTFMNSLSKGCDGCMLISASGGKHAPGLAKEIGKKLSVTLITTNQNAPAAKFVKNVIVFPKQREPYTYNTSTYLGMLLASDAEKVKGLVSFLQKIKVPDLKKYNAFFLVLPNEFALLREMFVIKFDELFGPRVNGRVYSVEQARHAKSLVRSSKELYISFDKKTGFGENEWVVPLPKNIGYGGMMALGYYCIGQIQKQFPAYFKRSIGAYVKRMSKDFGEEIKVWVE